MNGAVSSWKKFCKGFRYAGAGVWYCVRTERNFRVHLVAGVAVLRLSAFYELTKGEWAVLLLAIGGVLGAELLNTAVERAVDLISPKPHPLAKAAKDAAAGGVLIAAIAAAAVGVVLLWDTAIFERIIGYYLLSGGFRRAEVLCFLLLGGWFAFGFSSSKDESAELMKKKPFIQRDEGAEDSYSCRQNQRL